MATIIELTADVSVAPQLGEVDFAEIARRGFRSIINNRPDDETGVTVLSGHAAELAAKAGLAYRAIPCPPAEVTEAALVDAVAEALDELPAPVLLYCRSGTRSTLLWAQSQAGRVDTDTLIETAARGGYDIAVIRDELDERAAAERRKAPRVPQGAFPTAIAASPER